jgi:hypothetical protein
VGLAFTRGGAAPGARALLPGAWLALTALCLPLPAAADALDDFETLAGWTATASEGARLELAHDAGRAGMALRLDFEFGAMGGFVIARKEIAPRLPDNYVLSFEMRGDALPNALEFKLVDRSNRNVWRFRRAEAPFPATWTRVVVRKRRIEFAWGPAAGGDPRNIYAIEFAIASGQGGKGSVWIDDLRLEPREPATRVDRPPAIRASTSAPGAEPERMLDNDLRTAWRSGALATGQWLILDLLGRREYGGLVIDWDREDFATKYRVEVSDDGKQWTAAYETPSGKGGRDYVYMPDAESRHLRILLDESSRGRGYAIRSLSVRPIEFSGTPNQFFETIAREAPPGAYPKYFLGRQTYWTLVGVDGDREEGLLNEEGMLEVNEGGFSIEPFVYTGGRLITWHDVTTTQTLEDGYLPIPSVTWEHAAIRLRITAFAAGSAGDSMLYARYRIESRADHPDDIVLFLAVRPFQVLPPWQNLNVVGGVATIDTLRQDGRTVIVDGTRPVHSLTPPDRFGATTFEEADITEFLAAGVLPGRTAVMDPLGYASGALEYRMTLGPGDHGEVDLAVPFPAPAEGPTPRGERAAPVVATTRDDAGAGRDRAPFVLPDDRDSASAHTEARLAETAGLWRRVLGRVDVELPAESAYVIPIAKTQLAYILINRDGAALQPGSRTYARSWIRDGAMTSSALLSAGFTEPVREFIRWYSKFQFQNGKVPCCVDRRGADHVPEHDSPGQYIYTIAEYYRFTRDIGLVYELWPTVVGAVDYLVGLRQQRTTAEFERPGKQEFFGLLPESISHEGYAAHPVHSYWDDFFALRGLKDAAMLANVIGDEARTAIFSDLREEFARDVHASIRRTMARHRIDYLPASVELGDFDPSSTAIAIDPGGELTNLPAAALAHTFDRYVGIVQDRQRGGEWDAYTPYELRNVVALVRLNQRDRAIDLLRGFARDRRPLGWNQWPEVVWKDAQAPRFIGDMPHTWVGATFLRAVRSLFVYEREEDRALVIAAGVPRTMAEAGHGCTARRLATYYGVLNVTLRGENGKRMRVRLGGDLTVPPGGFVIQPPSAEPIRAVTVNGTPVTTFTADAATIREFPAEVVLEYAAPAS